MLNGYAITKSGVKYRERGWGFTVHVVDGARAMRSLCGQRLSLRVIWKRGDLHGLLCAQCTSTNAYKEGA